MFRLRLGDIKDEVHNRTGAPQLDYWCREVVGMDRVIRGTDQTTDLDHPANLEKLLSFLHIDIPHSQYGTGFRIPLRNRCSLHTCLKSCFV